MKGRILLGLFCAALALFAITPAQGQTISANGTAHGVTLTWTASTSTVQGNYIFRCPGTCTNSSTGWVAITGLIAGTSYLDPASGLTVNSTYSYAAAAVDASGNQSSFSNIATVSLPSAFPANPNSPTNFSAAVK